MNKSAPRKPPGTRAGFAPPGEAILALPKLDSAAANESALRPVVRRKRLSVNYKGTHKPLNS